MQNIFERFSPTARDTLQQALSSDETRYDLAAAAVAMLERPDLDVEQIQHTFAQLAAEVRDALAANEATSVTSSADKLEILVGVLSVQHEFRRDHVANFGKPENSFIDHVLETRVGIPISLSMVYLEVARRAGIPLFGVSFPGHFLVAGPVEDNGLGKPENYILDPTNAGMKLTRENCQSLLDMTGQQMLFTPKMIEKASLRTIVYRMLTNLKLTYLQQGDGERALKVVDLLLFLNPNHPLELRTRASILSSLGAFQAALSDVEQCLHLIPQAPDAAQLQMAAKALRQKMHFLN